MKCVTEVYLGDVIRRTAKSKIVLNANHLAASSSEKYLDFKFQLLYFTSYSSKALGKINIENYMYMYIYI